MKNKMIFLLVTGLLLVNSCADKSYNESGGLSVEKAQTLIKHGLTQDAKVILIDIIFSKSGDDQKAEAYFMLGNIAFEENKISLAFEMWNDLMDKYPDSEFSDIVNERKQELAGIFGELEEGLVEDVVALTYLRNGDFWSKGKSDIFMIDNSWISNVDAAVNWYDKAIKEFPKSSISRVAYESKLRTLLGWKESSYYGSSYGVKESFNKYMPQLLETFASFEKEHPEATTLQAFRYQIAQAFWSNRKWEETREWLNLIIEKSQTEDSFYKDLAERRLQKVEY